MPYIYEDIDIKIAKISFGFNNKELLSLLTERGSIITSGELEKIPKVNLKIDDLIKEKRTELIRPVAAFITFERQEGKDRATKYFISEAQRQKEEKEANEGAADGETDF